MKLVAGEQQEAKVKLCHACHIGWPPPLGIPHAGQAASSQRGAEGTQLAG